MLVRPLIQRSKVKSKRTLVSEITPSRLEAQWGIFRQLVTSLNYRLSSTEIKARPCNKKSGTRRLRKRCQSSWMPWKGTLGLWRYLLTNLLWLTSLNQNIWSSSLTCLTLLTTTLCPDTWYMTRQCGTSICNLRCKKQPPCLTKHSMCNKTSQRSVETLTELQVTT